MPALPFKLNQDRRHHIPEQKRKVTNWRDYDESLRRRGSLTVWFSDEAVEAWEAERHGGRRVRPRERLRRRGRAPPGRGRRRSAALDRRAQRHGRDRADAAGPPPATHRREGQDGLAEGLGLQQCARPG